MCIRDRASGDLLFQLPVGTLHPPATSGAAFTAIAGASSPAERFVVAAFDSGAYEYLDTDMLTMPTAYAGGGVTVKVVTSASATAGGTAGYVFGAAFRRIADDAEDLDTTSHSYTFNDSAEIQPPSVDVYKRQRRRRATPTRRRSSSRCSRRSSTCGAKRRRLA